MTCYGILRPKSLPLSSENLSLYFASLITEARSHLLIQRWKESQALSSLLFVSTFASVIRTFVFLLPLFRVDKSNFPQSQSAQLQQHLSTEEDEQPLSVDLWANKSWNFSWQDSILKTTAPLRITERVSDDNCHKPQTSRCQGDDTLVAFQPMGIFRFWRNGQFTFLQRCLRPLYFSRSPPPTQLNLPFCAGVQFSRDYIRAFKYMYEKIEGCEQSTVFKHLWHHLVPGLYPWHVAPMASTTAKSLAEIRCFLRPREWFSLETEHPLFPLRISSQWTR